MSGTMKKFQKTFSIAKQNLMEKTSNRENTLEPEEMKALEKQISDSKTNIRKVTKSIQKETMSSSQTIQDGTELSNNLIDYSVFIRDNYQDLVILQGILSKVGEFQAGFEDLKAKLNTSLIQEVSNPLKSITKTEIVQAQNQKDKYDKVRVAYDASLSELQQMKKKKEKPQRIQEQEVECETNKMKFENCGVETSSVLADTNVIAEFETVEKLCDYLDLYHTFFQKGYRWLAQMIPDIYEYRLYVEKRKAELEKSKVRMSMMLSPQKSDGPKSKVFGEDLSVLLSRDGTPIPKIVILAFRTIRNHINEEGLFRLSGTKRIIMEMKKNIDDGKDYSFDEITDIHVVCNMIKLFLRELQPEPLLTYSRYNEFIDVCNIEDQNARVAKLAKIISTLPKHYYTLLHHLMHLLSQIATSPKSKMGPANLATVIGPNILVSQNDVVVEDIALVNMVITTIIQNFDKIFEGPPTLITSIPPSTSTSNLASTFNNHNNNNSSSDLSKPKPQVPYRSPNTSPDHEDLPIYSGVPMKNKINENEDEIETLDDSFDEDDAVELSD